MNIKRTITGVDDATIHRDLLRVFQEQGALSRFIYDCFGNYAPSSVMVRFRMTWNGVLGVLNIPLNIAYRGSGRWTSGRPVVSIDRVCLRCELPFKSRDRVHNRVCAPCKGSNGWKDAQGSLDA